jgi:predicted lipid-binding transport protein (Tim44 family)
MKLFSVFVALMAFGLTLVSDHAEAARRIGGGKSLGMQRQMTAPARPPAAAPAKAASTPTAGQPNRSWMGPLAGLAAGIGLAALASHFGFGEQLASMMMIGLLIFVVMGVIGYLMRRRTVPQNNDALQYATTRPATSANAPKAYDLVMPGSTAPVAAQGGSTVLPADFDVTEFVRNAKVRFIRLQALNDAGNLDDIREFTTPEMFAELKMDMHERGDAPQKTDVVTLDAEVLEVVEEDARQIVSVRFHGLIREDNGTVEPVDEAWNFVRARSSGSLWLVAGIQQMQ